MLNISLSERYFILVLLISAALLINLSYRHKIISTHGIEMIEIKDKQAPITDINTATVEQLEYLPGIGHVIAKDIILYREKIRAFKNTEELKKVKGIADKKFEGLKGFITTGD